MNILRKPWKAYLSCHHVEDELAASKKFASILLQNAILNGSLKRGPFDI